MQRIACEERTDWRERADKVGFVFHSSDNEPYWDESAYYAFTLEEIERDLEAPTAALDGMCRELVARAVTDEQIMRRLAIPVAYWNWLAASWERGGLRLCGRLRPLSRADGPG